MRRFLLLASILALLGTFSACDEYTGHPRCDIDMAPPLWDIWEEHVNVDCSPNFSAYDQYGIYHHAWWDPARKMVWVWPDKMSDRLMFKILWHESGHVHGHVSEWAADAYAWCHMTPEQRLGIGFLSPKPTSCQGFLQ